MSILLILALSPVAHAADSDGDGVDDTDDRCPGYPDASDADADTVPDGCDLCPGANDLWDADADTVPDGCDACPGGDDTIDTDTDGVPDACDLCPGFPDFLDSDNDAIPDGCDSSPSSASLEGPNPGLAGTTNTFTFTGGTPLGWAYLLVGSSRGTTSIPGCATASLDLVASNAVPLGAADPSGDLTATLDIPAAAGGQLVYFQVAQPDSCVVSNAVSYEFP